MTSFEPYYALTLFKTQDNSFSLSHAFRILFMAEVLYQGTYGNPLLKENYSFSERGIICHKIGAGVKGYIRNLSGVVSNPMINHLNSKYDCTPYPQEINDLILDVINLYGHLSIERLIIIQQRSPTFCRIIRKENLRNVKTHDFLEFYEYLVNLRQRWQEMFNNNNKRHNDEKNKIRRRSTTIIT